MEAKSARYTARYVSAVRAVPGVAELLPSTGHLDDGAICYVTEDGDLYTEIIGVTAPVEFTSTKPEAWLRFCREHPRSR